MNKIVKNSFSWASAFSACIFTLIPENVFGKLPGLGKVGTCITCIWNSIPLSAKEMSALLGRLLVLLIFFAVALFINWCIFSHFVKIGSDYPVIVKYGNLLKCRRQWEKQYLKVIPFDECFTTSVGTGPGEIKASSLCGQYLTKYPITDMQGLIDEAGLMPLSKPSKYRAQTRYKAGSLIRREELLGLSSAFGGQLCSGKVAARQGLYGYVGVICSYCNSSFLGSGQGVWLNNEVC